MFGIDFSELLLIGIVALVVIGPERLPRVARTAGLLFGRMQRYVADVKADINREINAEELRKLQDEMRASVNSLEQSVAKQLREGDEALQQAKAQIHEIVEVPQPPLTTTPTGGTDAAPRTPDPQMALNLDEPQPPAPQHTNTPPGPA